MDLTVFDASIRPALGGGTILRGSVGPRRNNAMTMLAVAAIMATIGVGIFVGGVVDFAHGHSVHSLPFVLVSLGLIAFAVLIAPSKRGVRLVLGEISALMQDVTKLLDATFTLLD
jgi:hypothetical protein